MSIYTKFLANVCDLTPCSSDRNWHLVLLRDTDAQTIFLLNRWIDKIRRRESPQPPILFVIVLDSVASEMEDFNPEIEDMVVVCKETIPQILSDKAKHCLFTCKDPNPANTSNTLEEINQKFGSYLSKRTVGMFGRCSDCHDLCMREGRKIRYDLQLYRYSDVETKRLAFTRWKRRLCRSASRLL